MSSRFYDHQALGWENIILGALWNDGYPDVQSKMAKEKDFNRLKVVLAEKKKTNKWLAEQLGKDPATISKWCTNSAQPGLETLYQIAECLEVDVKDILVSTKEENIFIYKK